VIEEEDTLEERREQLRDAIRGAFYSLAEEDKGLPTHMVAAFIEYYMTADHTTLTPQQQVGIIGIAHQAVLKMLHANPASLQMAHAHAYVHTLVDTYISEDSEDEEDSDLLLEENAEDLAEWASELEQYMEEQEEKHGGEGPAGPSDQNPESD